MWFSQPIVNFSVYIVSQLNPERDAGKFKKHPGFNIGPGRISDAVRAGNFVPAPKLSILKQFNNKQCGVIYELGPSCGPAPPLALSVAAWRLANKDKHSCISPFQPLSGITPNRPDGHRKQKQLCKTNHVHPIACNRSLFIFTIFYGGISWKSEMMLALGIV